VPDPAIQHHYEFVKYLHGAGSRPKAPPMPLQGVWTADAGGLPPWKGDYHHDLNTQTTYIAYQAAGLFEEGRVFLNDQWALLPRYQRFAKEFYGVQGAVVPGVATLDGSPMGGWGMYSLSPTNSAWIAHLFERHWAYTQDSSFLKSRAYPWCSEVGIALSSLLVQNSEGRWVLPLSSSPEIHDNSMKAWMSPNTNYDQALLLGLFSGLERMAAALNRKAESVKWGDWKRKLIGKAGSPMRSLARETATGVLWVNHEEPLTQTHRHHSHLMALHPIGLWDPNSATDLAIAEASIDSTLKLGTKQWVGYSFSWMACHLARLGRGEQAREYLRKFVDAFILRNGFHANGDQTDLGHSDFRYRPFTLEGNFLAMEAVHEMLLQSWSDELRVFPAVPRDWTDVSFERLRAEGGLEVTGRLVKGVVVDLRIKSQSNRVVKIRFPDGSLRTESLKGRTDTRVIPTKL
jgi:alpha-L-fucosidase 2